MKAYYTNADNFTTLVGERVLLHQKNGGCYAGKLVREHKHLYDKKYMDSIVFVGFCPFHLDLENNNPHNFRQQFENAYTDADALNYKTAGYIADENGENNDNNNFIIEYNDNLKLWDIILKENKENFEPEKARMKKEFNERFELREIR
ncbi:MAG: hypothetical protein WC428_02000 [Candidatus Paceibacterota bacterium]